MKLTPKQRCQLRKSSGAKLLRRLSSAGRSTKPGLRRSAAGTAKYRNKPTAGYDSKKEARRAAELKLMQKLGKIHDLREQRPWPLIPHQRAAGKIIERACTYVSDFDYIGLDGGRVVEDCKGVRTAAYIIKRKLMLWVHGVRIKET